MLRKRNLQTGMNTKTEKLIYEKNQNRVTANRKCPLIKGSRRQL